MKPYFDSFEYIFEKQKAFQTLVEKREPIDDPFKFQYHMNAMTEEMGETLKADKRWKTHRNATFIPDEKLDEIADMFITNFNVAMWSGFTRKQLEDAIIRKIEENTKRFVEKERESDDDNRNQFRL